MSSTGEDTFVRKLQRVGFQHIEVRDRAPLSVDDCALYPLFSDEVIELIRKLVPAERQRAVADAWAWRLSSSRSREPRRARRATW